MSLKRLADTMFESFQSFKDGARFYRCEGCGRIFKVETAAVRVVNAAKQ